MPKPKTRKKQPAKTAARAKGELSDKDLDKASGGIIIIGGAPAANQIRNAPAVGGATLPPVKDLLL